MSLEDTTTTKKENVTSLKNKYDELNEKITGIQELTKTRWMGIDKTLYLFKNCLFLLIFLNLVTISFAFFL